MRKLIPALLVLFLLVGGCTPLERTAYNTIVASKAFLDNERTAHPECASAATSTVCVDIAKAVAAQNLLVTAAEVYCSSPAFDSNGGACTPPAKGTPAAQQAINKLNAAIAAYNQAATELKGVVK